MTGIDPAACRFALSQIADGFIFEDFAQQFLAAVLGHSFIPVGGIKDKGIDGLGNIFSPAGNDKVVYQLSIEKDPEGKCDRTLKLLKDNKIRFHRFTYVTNQELPGKEKIIESLTDKYRKPIQIFDLAWFSVNVNTSPGTVTAYEIFISSYLHEFQKPGVKYVVGDLIEDPRLYVFLRQQWESDKSKLKLDEVLADTLIYYALEGTDPDKGILKTRSVILAEIGKHLKFEPKLLTSQIQNRLHVLSAKPHRKIRHHVKEDAYCLPFETRQELVNKNLRDAALHQEFRESVTTELKRYLREEEIRVKDCVELIDLTLNKLFYKQGLEFSDLVSSGYSKEAFEKSLPATIAEAVDESRIINKNRQGVKQILLLTIRNIVYQGTPSQKEYLRCLANTYMLLFLLQCDPKLSLFFSSMASKLDVYVCTSILVPALSEICLEPQNRRYWNLLSGARNAGVRLRIDETILKELAAHFRKISHAYQVEYSDNEELYADESSIFYIDEILIRAYYYSKLQQQVCTFREFIDKFCTPDLINVDRELTSFLHEAFGIEFVSHNASGVKIDEGELIQLESSLTEQKRDKNKAHNDAKLILTIFALRDKNREANPENWSGYRTWWLSSDTLTQRTVNRLFGEKYKVSCYMRPDFLYNYISLTPGAEVVSDIYKSVFPNLLGVNISHKIPDEVVDTVRAFIKDHKDKGKHRIKGILNILSDRLKSDPAYMSRTKIKLFLEEQKEMHLI